MSVPVPKLRFKNFSQALINGPFEQYIKSSKYGPRFDANDYDLNGNVKTIRGTDVALDATIKYEQVPIANLPQKLIDEHQLQKGDILMITTADCGLSAVFEKQEIPFIASAYAVRIVLKNSLDSLWVKYYLQTQHIVNEVNKYVRKGTLSNLPLSDISKFSFTVPALEEQTKIATFLSAVDEKISQLTQKHELLSQYKQGMMQKLFSQQLRFKADDGSEFGEWENSYIGNECKITTGNKDTQNKVDDGLYPFFVRSQTVEKINSYSMDCEAILTSGDGVGVGKNYHYMNGKFDFHQRVYCLYEFSERLIGRYLYIYFSNYFYDRVKRLSAKNSVDSVRMDMISKMEIKLPCLEEQTKIANFLSAIDQKIEVVAQQIEQAKTWKTGLLQQMFV